MAVLIQKQREFLPIQSPMVRQHKTQNTSAFSVSLRVIPPGHDCILGGEPFSKNICKIASLSNVNTPIDRIFLEATYSSTTLSSPTPYVNCQLPPKKNAKKPYESKSIHPPFPKPKKNLQPAKQPLRPALVSKLKSPSKPFVRSLLQHQGHDLGEDGAQGALLTSGK